MKNVVLPFRGEFGLKVWWHVPAVHAIAGPKAVYIEEGEEALYPADRHHTVVRREDGLRRNTYKRDEEFVRVVEKVARTRYPGAELLRPTDKWPRSRFKPRPHLAVADIRCDVVVGPRKRDYGAEKNWDTWPALVEQMRADGLAVFAGGVADSSYDVPGPRAWDWDRPLDATLVAMENARVVVSTDAGLAHLAVLCGRPLIMVTHGEGLVAPGPVREQPSPAYPEGRIMEPAYWPVKMERFHEANHLGADIELVPHAWLEPHRVLDAIYRRFM